MLAAVLVVTLACLPPAIRSHNGEFEEPLGDFDNRDDVDPSFADESGDFEKAVGVLDDDIGVEEAAPSPLALQLESNDTALQISVLRAIREDIADSTQPGDVAAKVAVRYGTAVLAVAADCDHHSVQVEALTLLQRIAESGTEAADALARCGALSSLNETLSRTLELPGSDMEDIVGPLTAVLGHLPWVDDVVTSAAIVPLLQLLGNTHPSVTRAAISMLGTIPMMWSSIGQTGPGECIVMLPGIADALIEHGVVEKLSLFLLSWDDVIWAKAAELLSMLVMATICAGPVSRSRGSRLTLVSIVDAGLLPNALSAVTRRREAEDSSDLIFFTCSLLLHKGDGLQRRYAIDNGCVERACESFSSPHFVPLNGTHFVPLNGKLTTDTEMSNKITLGKLLNMVLAFEEILRDSVVLGQRVANTIASTAGCQQSFEGLTGSSDENISGAAKELLARLPIHATGLHRLPTTGEMLSSPWAPWVGAGILVALGLSVLWCFVIHPSRQHRQWLQDERRADQNMALLIAQEEAKTTAKKCRPHRHQPEDNALTADGAGQRPGKNTKDTVADQPTPAASASDAATEESAAPPVTPSSSNDTIMPGGGFGISVDHHQQQREEAMADDGGQWTQTARRRKKKGRRAGSGSADAPSRQQAGQAISSVFASPSGETVSSQPLPSTAGGTSDGTRGPAVTGGMAYRQQHRPPRPAAPPLVTPPLKQHSSLSTESGGAATAAADGCSRVGELSSGTTAVTLSSPPSSPSDDSDWVRGMEAAWSEWGSGQGGGHHSHDPTERQRREAAAAADDAHSVDPARAMALEQKQQAVDRLQELRHELDGKLAAIASLEQRKAKLIHEKEVAMRNAPKSVDELHEVVRAGGVASGSFPLRPRPRRPPCSPSTTPHSPRSNSSAADRQQWKRHMWRHREREQDTATEGAAAASGSSSADAGGPCGPPEGGSSSGAGVDDGIGGLGLDEQLAQLTQRISEVEQQLGSGELDRRLRCLSHDVGKLQSRVDAIKMDSRERPSMACLSSIHTVAEATAFLARVMGRIQQLDGLMLRAHQEENRQLQRRIDDREEDELCAVCQAEQRTVVLIGKAPSTCRHRCLYVTCWHKRYAPWRGNTQCPICRSDIDYRQSGPTI
ncbi:unnamed protein product [Vitrella brassicaformis CCMP3155]|uniref:RING-type domain-containing protein n=1 Tax=Vitrella brassicaformis (strain CCMP3155) TaxID=1169540 RepID=A0A0G4GV55_VITBC|nr:unnamed protein product [Vitrella brassicaformis CCMP3155]|eukprot:CEM34779.1 unnamed protein product [Vitrella brassicaformis CCMP3155]